MPRLVIISKTIYHNYLKKPYVMVNFCTEHPFCDSIYVTYTKWYNAFFFQIDILVNNAGRSQRAFVKDTKLEVDQAIMELNYIGVISLTKAVLPHMLTNKKGHIVVTSSVAGKLGKFISLRHCLCNWNMVDSELISKIMCYNCVYCCPCKEVFNFLFCLFSKRYKVNRSMQLLFSRCSNVSIVFCIKIRTSCRYYVKTVLLSAM